MTPDKIISALRIIALVAAGVQVLGATVLWGIAWPRFFQPWLQLFERHGGPLPPVLRSSSTWRLINLAFTAPALVLWWLLGTPGFRAAFEGVAATP